MKRANMLSLLLLATIMTSVHAQHVITYDANSLRNNDEICSQEITPVPIGDAGENAEWKFSDIRAIGNYKIYLSQSDDEDSLTILSFHPQKMYRYRCKRETLEIAGYETSLRYMSYVKPEIIMKYPFSYGDIIRNPFEGTGYYCGTNRVDLKGEILVEADGYGRMIIPDDTIDNVLRVHTIRTNSINMNLLNDTTIFDPNNLKQEIQESYSWYGRGFRYPLFEVKTTTSYNNMKPISSVTNAYCFLPENQRLINDSINESVEEDGKEESIFHYNVISDRGDIGITYTLEEDANICILLSDKMGIIYRNLVKFQKKGASYEEHFSCDGLKSGVYILYISVNGNAYSEKVNVY